MNKLLKLISLSVSCFLFVSLHAQNKTRINFDKDWKFKLDSIQSYNEPGLNDAAGESQSSPRLEH